MMKKGKIKCGVEIHGSKSGDKVEINQKDCNKAHKTLGAMETPSGNTKKRLIGLF